MCAFQLQVSLYINHTFLNIKISTQTHTARTLKWCTIFIPSNPHEKFHTLNAVRVIRKFPPLAICTTISLLWVKITQWRICLYKNVFHPQMVWYVRKLCCCKKTNEKNKAKTWKCVKVIEWVLLLNLAIFCRILPILYLLGIFHPQVDMKVKLSVSCKHSFFVFYSFRSCMSRSHDANPSAAKQAGIRDCLQNKDKAQGKQQLLTSIGQ